MSTHHVKEFTSTVLDKPLREFSICCPLHLFAFERFKEVLLKGGYEIAHPSGVFYHRPSRELIYPEIERFDKPYKINFLTTLDSREIQSLFFQALREEYKNKYVLIEGTESYKIQNNLSGSHFDEIKLTLPQSVIAILENSLWNFEEYCNRFLNYNLSNTLGILLYGPPGVGKSFILRSYFNKLLLERNFTLVQVYQKCLKADLNLSVLLHSCQALFPCILFLEDIDMMFKDREERTGTLAGLLLETFEGLSQVEKVVLIATSNNVDVIEKALLRPGRIDYPIRIENPSKSAKELVLSEYLDGSDLNLPLPLKEMVVNSVDTFAELKGSFQHLLRTYLSTGSFPSLESVSKLINTWKEAKAVGVLKEKERKAGLI